MLWRHNRQELGLYWGVPVFPVWLDTDQQWTLSTQEHQGEAGRHNCAATDVITKYTNCPISAWQMLTLRKMCRLWIKNWLMKLAWGRTTQDFFFLFLFCKWKLHYKPGQKLTNKKNIMDRKKAVQQQIEEFFFLRNGKCKTLSALLSLRVADQWHSKCHLAAWKLF